jgi:CHAT domain-containing protein
LLVVPVGEMAGVPAEAMLPDDRFTVSYVPSGTQLARCREQERPPAGRTFLGLGDPAFARADGLPGSGREVQAVAALFDRPALLLRSAASARRLDELRDAGRLGQFRYLHLATHGEASHTRPFESALVLAPDALPGPLSGRSPARSVQDGRLTAREVLEGWRLEAELVVLSACETGLGRPGGGDGLLGFAQAFLLAGSRGVVLSLWAVDDTATALLMQRFYQNLLGRRNDLDKPLPKAEALREAKRWLRELTGEQVAGQVARLPRLERSGERKHEAVPLDPQRPFAHPYYWSAFILIGDPD